MIDEELLEFLHLVWVVLRIALTQVLIHIEATRDTEYLSNRRGAGHPRRSVPS